MPTPIRTRGGVRTVIDFRCRKPSNAGRTRASRIVADRIIRVLGEHGADVNQRWCEFESRGQDESDACTSPFGVTPLLMAAMQDDPGAVFLLLQAGANARLENQFGSNALEYARSEAVFFLLLPATVPHTGNYLSEALEYLGRRAPRSLHPGPWDETPLARAIVGDLGGVPLPGPPPKSYPYPYQSVRVGRVRLLLFLGADPNERLTTGGVDWTPLGLAIATKDRDVARQLIFGGADVNSRWSVPIALDGPGTARGVGGGCDVSNGITPLMEAVSLGNGEIVADLLSVDPDLAARDCRNRTAMDLATAGPHAAIVRQLKQYSMTLA